MGLASGLTALLPRSVGQGFLAVAAAFVLYSLALVIQRLFFHPLRKIPGPWIAAATSWYEFYQDVILGGHYVKEYPNMHAKYGSFDLEKSKGKRFMLSYGKGTVVRVSPDRVHVSDPEFFHE